MPSPKVVQLFQEKLGFAVPEANSLGEKAEAIVNALAGLPSGDTPALQCLPPKNPVLHSSTTEFLVTKGVARRTDQPYADYGGLLNCVAVLMTGRDGGQINRDKFRIDAVAIGGYEISAGA